MAFSIVSGRAHVPSTRYSSVRPESVRKRCTSSFILPRCAFGPCLFTNPARSVSLPGSSKPSCPAPVRLQFESLLLFLRVSVGSCLCVFEVFLLVIGGSSLPLIGLSGRPLGPVGAGPISLGSVGSCLPLSPFHHLRNALNPLPAALAAAPPATLSAKSVPTCAASSFCVISPRCSCLYALYASYALHASPPAAIASGISSVRYCSPCSSSSTASPSSVSTTRPSTASLSPNSKLTMSPACTDSSKFSFSIFLIRIVITPIVSTIYLIIEIACVIT